MGFGIVYCIGKYCRQVLSIAFEVKADKEFVIL